MMEIIYKESLQIDETIVRRLGCLLNNCSIEENFSELSHLIPCPLIPHNNTDTKLNVKLSLETDKKLVDDYNEMLHLLYFVNEDRIKLREMLFKLLCEISTGISNSHFQNFISRSQLVHYELLKKWNEKRAKEIDELKSQLKAAFQQIENLKENKNEASVSCQTESEFKLSEKGNIEKSKELFSYVPIGLNVFVQPSIRTSNSRRGSMCSTSSCVSENQIKISRIPRFRQKELAVQVAKLKTNQNLVKPKTHR
ncbi:unnamed protein product [Blepharisma stoltei]|uniref:Uncharacterized protein n=1 Tax=Blepharisma stoltei TaxID=1481888 RepID=A0AAU9K7B1_9CILI|nr:unnamed protein product [Blepharisma stoltei]